jgi:hypothetical protein
MRVPIFPRFPPEPSAPMRGSQHFSYDTPTNDKDD